MSKRKVLYICHNHPSLHPGGAETCALELYEAMRASDEFEPIFLARIGSTSSIERPPHPGTPFSTVSTVNGDKNQYFVHAEMSDFDMFYLSLRNKDIYTVHFHEFLAAHQPDIVHFQHTHFLGYDLIREVRATLPDAPIVYTLHEYLPICHRQGQMVRATDDGLCADVSPELFFLRKRFIQSHFELVDAFLAPSRFLLERYVAWGIPRRRIRFEDYGRLPAAAVSERADGRPRNRIGFFGQFT